MTHLGQSGLQPIVSTGGLEAVSSQFISPCFHPIADQRVNLHGGAIVQSERQVCEASEGPAQLGDADEKTMPNGLIRALTLGHE